MTVTAKKNAAKKPAAKKTPAKKKAEAPQEARPPTWGALVRDALTELGGAAPFGKVREAVAGMAEGAGKTPPKWFMGVVRSGLLKHATLNHETRQWELND